VQQEGSGGGVIVLAPGPAAQSGGPAVTEETICERTALGRATLMAGAVSAVAAMTLRYSGEREQFGRPIARFQAV
jgi:acyl-CoA dehydrogenase